MFNTQKITEVMKIRKGLKATIVAMAAITNVSVAEECAAAKAAFADMESDGHHAVIIEMNPFGGLIA
jgi:hypothetical protein